MIMIDDYDLWLWFMIMIDDLWLWIMIVIYDLWFMIMIYYYALWFIAGIHAQAMLMTWTFIGFTLGTMASGPLGDSFGRRNPMILGYCGVVITAACTTMAMNVYMLSGFRLIMGFFAGIGIPVACITISEVFPSAHRGMATAGLGVGPSRSPPRRFQKSNVMAFPITGRC